MGKRLKVFLQPSNKTVTLLITDPGLLSKVSLQHFDNSGGILRAHRLLPHPTPPQ